MNSRNSRRDFTDVDRAADPQHFMRLLDSITAMDFARQYKQRTFEMLEPLAGAAILDVGCGVGDDAREIAARVGPSGRVIGVDRSEALIAEARQRSAPTDLPLAFEIGDATALEFADDTFDGCRADRVLHHLEQPEKAIQEMLRVARPGARLVMAEPDFETAILDAPNHSLTRKLLNLNCDSYRNGWIGRQMPRLLKRAGAADVSVEPFTILLTDYAVAERVLALEGTVGRAKELGVASSAECDDWLSQLKAASARGEVFGSITAFYFTARNPA